MDRPTARVILRVSHPIPNQQFPVGVDFQVSGTAVGAGGDEPNPIASVTVQMDAEPPVEAELFDTDLPHLGMSFRADMRLSTPGEHQITVTATAESGRSSTQSIPVSTPGTTHCQNGVMWTNYPQTQSLVPVSTCTPESLADLVAIIRQAEAANHRVHAFGSKWSFSDCAFTTDVVIDTTHLYRELQTVQRALRAGHSNPLYHVQAGITIRGLYNNLDRLGLALETMGGASGQTLAGAISTGTHGGDKFMPPLADSVLAIHLVGAGGSQYWIEPSIGITDPVLLRAQVVPEIDPQNIIYDDATFDACLVSLGCMGVIYAVVLRVRQAYDLVETTVETTWQAFKENASTSLNDASSRFLQVLVNPYIDGNNENLCLVTARTDANPTGPAQRPRGDVETAVRNMIGDMNIFAQHTLLHNGVFEGAGLSQEQRLAKIIEGVLTYTPDQQPVMVRHYGNIMRQLWPTSTFQGSSYSVMDNGYGQPSPSSEPSHSIELFFPALDTNGRLGCADFVDAVIGAVNAATGTFFAGYVSLRFTSSTRAYLGMQRWNQTCAVEISVVQGVQGLLSLLTQLFRMGFNIGGLPHWGQLLDLGVQGHGRLYPQYAQWRQIYGRMSNNFSARTFENWLSVRWRLTTPNDARFVAQTVSQVMEAGQSQSVTVTMQNTGVFTWPRSGSYRLGSPNPEDSVVWGLNRVDLFADVLPGDTVTFQFSITAPQSPGAHKFQWRMVQESVEWFGESTPNVTISVEPPAGQTIVPDVQEMDPHDAAEAIEAAGLVPRIMGLGGLDAYVYSQSPQPNTVVARGSTVTLRIRRPPRS